MAIQRVKSDTEIKSGQWINKESIFRDALCGRALRVIKVSGQRVYHTQPDGSDEGDYCAKKSVVFVSDEQKEAQTLYSISEAKMKKHTAFEKEIKVEFQAKVNALIDARAEQNKEKQA